jgi:hypothetical protein
MSLSVSKRPLSLVPFLAADAVLLATALLIAWRTSDELSGGALLGVVVCVVLGAVLAVLPFVLNDAHAREAALAERQRELSELVTTSTANASRWGTQWAAAAMGLEDAATLASRSIASAEQLPAVFQEKADAFAQKLEQVEREAHARAELAAKQEAALTERAEQIGATAATLQQTLAEFARVEAGLREQRTVIATTLEEVPAAAAQARVARAELDERLAAAPAEIEAQVSRCAGEAEARLGATVSALTVRLAEVEATLGSFLTQLERAASAPIPVAPVVSVPAPVPAAVAAPESVVVSEPVVVVATAPVAADKQPERVATIMDPFLIPDDGYASLAEAMDTGRA